MNPMKLLLLAAAAAPCVAFAPPPSTARPAAPRPLTVADALVDDAAHAASQLAIGIPVMYALFSANEYVTHRYYQHNELGKWQIYKKARRAGFPRLDGGGHVEHHAETYDDMSLKTDDAEWMERAAAKRMDQDKWRGTAFTWEVTAMMLAQCVPTVYPVFLLLGWHPLAITAFYVSSIFLHGLAWNALHPNMHGLEDVPAEVGLPSSVLAGLRGSWYFDLLYENHQGHHVAAGRKNYNVCCPGMDHLLGTYMAPEEWKPKMRAQTTRAIEGALATAEM